MPDAIRPTRFLLTALLTAGLAAAATAQTYVIHRIGPAGSVRGDQKVHMSKVSTGGETIRLWSATLVAPDCTASGTITAQLVDAPGHGHADIRDDTFYPNFLPPNPRVACDRVKVPGKEIFYTPDPAFHGHDKVVFQMANSDGFVRRITADIDVR